MVGGLLGRAIVKGMLDEHQMAMAEAVDYAQNPPPEATIGNFAKQLGRDFVEGAVLNQLPDPATQAIGMVRSIMEVAEPLKDGIKAAAEAGIPGYEYEEVKIGGIRYKFYVDASPEAFGHNTDTFIEPQPHIDRDDERAKQLFEAHQDRIEAKALGGVQGYLQNHSPAEYENKIYDFIENQIPRQFSDAGPVAGQDATMVAEAPQQQAPGAAPPPKMG